MSQQTKFEGRFIDKVIKFCLSNPGMTPHQICASFGYNNSVKINDFINGNGTISSRTMGKMIEHMNKNKPKKSASVSKFHERFNEMKLKRTMPKSINEKG